jgi:hypothetical protein
MAIEVLKRVSREVAAEMSANSFLLGLEVHSHSGLNSNNHAFL